MTALQLERKATGLCTRCGATAGDTNLCPPCEREHNEEARVSVQAIRDERRAAGLCAFCERVSDTFRCRVCRVARQLRERMLNTVGSASASRDI